MIGEEQGDYTAEAIVNELTPQNSPPPGGLTRDAVLDDGERHIAVADGDVQLAL